MSKFVQRFLLPGVFTDIDILGLEEIKRKARAGKRLIFIPDHQSEYDWLVLQNLLFRANVKTVIQAGDNLFVGPLDPILRGCGAFMSIRKEKKFYSVHWMYDLLMKGLGGKPLVINLEAYTKLYVKQLIRMLGKEKYNLLVFPGYETDPYSGIVKYGRSYSGAFNKLSPFVFISISKALRALGLEEAEYIPVSITYERVPEDILFREFKAETRRIKITKYIYDHYYTFIKAPFTKSLSQSKSRICIKFGQGIPAAFSGKARQFAEQIRFQIGRLSRVYESQLVFSSLHNKFTIPKKELKRNILRNLDKLKSLGIDCSPLYRENGELLGIDTMLRRVEKLFNSPKSSVIAIKTYLTLAHDAHEVFIHNPHLASYYGNKLNYILSKT